MGNLSNLYISQSFISLIHLGSDNTASATLTELQDGLGNGLGIYVNTEGDFDFGGVLYAHKGAELSGSIKINTETTQSTIPYLNVNTNNIVVPGNVIRIDGPSGSAGQTPPTISDVAAGWKVIGDGIPTPTYVLSVTHSLNRTDIEISSATAYYSSSYSFTEPPTFPNVSLSGSMDITGSLWVRDKITATDISASNSISASDLWVANTIHAYKLDVTIESASIIFTSGSNIIGDNANEDTQSLLGRVIATGSLEVTGSTRINGATTITGSTKISGSTDITGSLKVSADISSSTISGIGNVTTYSASVSQRIETNSSSFYNFSSSAYKNDSASFDSRLDAQEAFSSSLLLTFATDAELNASSSTLQANINTKLDTASFNSYTSSISSSNSLVSQSFVNTINSLSGAIYLTDATQSNNFTTNSSSVASRLNTIEVRYATTGSNVFVGNQTITGSLVVTGSMVYSGSVRGIVIPVTTASQTASMDLSLGNFFTIQLVSGSNTHISCSNIQPGETIALRLNQSTSSFGTVTFAPSIKLSQFAPYIATPISSSVDVLTFVSFDTTAIYGAAVNNLR